MLKTQSFPAIEILGQKYSLVIPLAILLIQIVATIIPRVHYISIEGECLTAYIPCTNALRQVTPVNYRILLDLIYA